MSSDRSRLRAKDLRRLAAAALLVLGAATGLHLLGVPLWATVAASALFAGWLFQQRPFDRLRRARAGGRRRAGRYVDGVFYWGDR